MSDKEITKKNLLILLTELKLANFKPVKVRKITHLDGKSKNQVKIGKPNPHGKCGIFGFAVSIKELQIEEDDFEFNIFDYGLYSYRIFPSLGMPCQKEYSSEDELDLWLFLFKSKDILEFERRVKKVIHSDFKVTPEFSQTVDNEMR